MAIYTPNHFRGEDDSLANRLIADNPFATLIVPAPDEPLITHIPILREADCLYGHVARANPIWQAFHGVRSIAIFHGPHAYVSPKWYPSGEPVPTWNYGVVHVHGEAQALDEHDSVDVLARLVQVYEPDFSLPVEEFAKRARGIVAFRMPIERMEVKFKMSQNRLIQDREGVVAALAERGIGDDFEVAACMAAIAQQ